MAQQLELTWAGKAVKSAPEPRVLVEQTAPGCEGAFGTDAAADAAPPDADAFDNRLIHGDNLPTCHALAEEFAGRISCIYLDPPFNTGQAFEHYADGVEHAGWLTLMRDRLEALHALMAEHGTLFVHIDDNELGYLIVVLDEIFGRANRLSVVTFKQGASTGHKAINPGCVSTTNFILMYAKNRAAWRPGRVFVPRGRDKRYAQFVMHRDKPPAEWEIVPLLSAYAQLNGLDAKAARARVKASPKRLDTFVLEHAGEVAQLVRPDYAAVSHAARAMIDASRAQPETVFHLPREKHSDFYFIGGRRILFYENKIKTIDGQRVSGEPLTTLWDDLLSNNLHQEGGVQFAKSKKPEALLKRMIALSTRPGEWVLDAFAGSGTTGAVAHKMGRRWIMIEAGDHCNNLIVPRLQRVMAGEDKSGVTGDVQWQGGGGFRFFRVERGAPRIKRPRVTHRATASATAP